MEDMADSLKCKTQQKSQYKSSWREYTLQKRKKGDGWHSSDSQHNGIRNAVAKLTSKISENYFKRNSQNLCVWLKNT